MKKLTHERETFLEQFEHYLYQRRYAENTIRTYVYLVRLFLSKYPEKQIADITLQNIEDFNYYHIVEQRRSHSFQNQFINAVKLFYKLFDNRNIDVKLIKRPRKEKKLPRVISKEEVKRILDATHNIKHKAILSLIYGCGLRLSESLNLKIPDLDSDRMMVLVRNSKGKKDRYVPLPHSALALLRRYYLAYRPKDYLFEGQHGGRYSDRSVQQILKRSLKVAGINKPYTVHCLRHSYATHLIEAGTNTAYVQELLGHKSIKTTQIYLHVSKKSLENVKSPLDEL